MSHRSHSPTRDRATPLSERTAALRAGKELPVTRGDMLDIEVGQVPGPHVRAVLALSSAINRSEGNRCSVSWDPLHRYHPHDLPHPRGDVRGKGTQGSLVAMHAASAA